MKIGFIGQGWIGKNYADDFERRGLDIVRYGKESPYDRNKDLISGCDIVFIAVPTPTTPKGFDSSIVSDVLRLVGKGKIAVIKSTILPGTTEKLQKENPSIFVLHSPEFLSSATAAEDAARPAMNIIGVPVLNVEYKNKAALVLSVLPKSPYEKICTSKEAEIIKYTHNTLGFVRIVFGNILYDLARSVGADWSVIQEAAAADPFNGSIYMNPVHKGGRGAGGHCFIKDFAAFAAFYSNKVNDPEGKKMIESIEKKNEELLRSTNKNLDILKDVYGK